MCEKLQWDDYTWDPNTEEGEFSIDVGDDEQEVLELLDYEDQPLRVTADKAKYFEELVFHLATQRDQAQKRAA